MPQQRWSDREHRAQTKADEAPLRARRLVVGPADDPAEREADQVAADIVRRLTDANASPGPLPATHVAGGRVQPRTNATAATSQRDGNDAPDPGRVQRRANASAVHTPPAPGPMIRRAEDEGIEMTTFKSNVVEEEEEALDEVNPAVTSAIKWVSESKDGDRKQAVEAFIQAKQQAKASKGGAEAEATALAVAKASASAEVKKTMTSLEVLVQAGVLSEASLELTGKYTNTLGPVTLQALGSVKAYATASLSASAKATIDTSGITLEASAEAVAEVGVNVSTAFSLATSKGSQLAKLSAEGQAKAGGRAKASGTATITTEGIALSGEFEAFAGFEAKGKINFVIGPDKAPYLTAVLKGGVSAGIGAKGSGTFKIEGGQIILSAELAATLGIGTSGGFDLAIGYQAIATAIYEGVAASFAPVEPRSNDIEMTTFSSSSD